MAGCAIPTSSAGHAPAGAKTDPKLTFDPDHPCPEPGFDGLEVEWPDGTVLVHPPYVARHELKGRGTKAWVVRALDHHKKGNKVIVILSVHEPIYMLLEAGAKIVPEGRVRCLHKITDKPDPHPPVTVGFVLEPKQESTLAAAANDDGRIDPLAKVSPELPPKLNLSNEKKVKARSVVERAMHPGNTVADLLSYVRAYHRITGGWMPSELDIGSFAVQIEQLKADKAAALADSAKAIKLDMENRQLKTRIRQLEFELASLKRPRRKER